VNVGGLVYGTITVGALLAAETRVRTGEPEIVGSVALALVAYWLAHAYAGLLARRVNEGDRLTASSIARALVRATSVLAGGAVPLLAVLAWWAGGAHTETAANAAVWAAVAVIVLIELAAALRARLSLRETVAQTAVGALVGSLLIALKLVLH
jgi:hypothetical protein